MKKLSLAVVLSVLTPALCVNAATGFARETQPALPRTLFGLDFQAEVALLRTYHQYSELTFRTGAISSATITESLSCRPGGITEDIWGTFNVLKRLRESGYGIHNANEPARILDTFWRGGKLRAPIDTTPVGTLEAYFNSSGPDDDGRYKTQVATRLLTAIEYGIATHDWVFIDSCLERGASIQLEHLEFAKKLYENPCFKPSFESAAYLCVAGEETSDEAQQEFFNFMLRQITLRHEAQKETLRCMATVVASS